LAQQRVASAESNLNPSSVGKCPSHNTNWHQKSRTTRRAGATRGGGADRDSSGGVTKAYDQADVAAEEPRRGGSCKSGCQTARPDPKPRCIPEALAGTQSRTSGRATCINLHEAVQRSPLYAAINNRRRCSAWSPPRNALKADTFAEQQPERQIRDE
jgi:hypothetical protein